MRVYKERQYLIFELDDGKTVKWDFAQKRAIGKTGKYVKNLKSQLSGYMLSDIVGNCSDKNYGNYLNFLQRCGGAHGNNISNIGTILENHERYSNIEQFYSAGLVVCKTEHDLSEIPKRMLNFFRKYNIPIHDGWLNYCLKDVNSFIVGIDLLEKNLFNSITENDIIEIYRRITRNIDFDDRFNYYRLPRNEENSFFNVLVNNGYNAKSLWLYIDRLMTYEGLSCSIINEIFDYALMQNAISRKYEKYPRNFLTTHRIASRNYNRLKKEFDESKFSSMINKDMEHSFGDFTFICPDKTQDIKDEATQMNNCVASYIERVMYGECQILFLRRKNEPDKSLVTIEVRDNKIVQAFQKYNTPCTNEQKNIIVAWNKWWKNKIKNNVS